MAVFETTVTSKGQMTLPVEIRRLWKLEPGERVEFYSDRSGRLFLRPLNVAPTAFFENIARPERLPGIRGDADAISKAVAERDGRAQRRRAAAE